MLNSYKDLIVWQKAIRLVKEIYKITEYFPQVERYGLSSQMRRAAVSIPSNIAEGYSRKHRQEYIQFVRIAFSSGAELETQLIIARDLGFIRAEDSDTITELLMEIMKMLYKLTNSLLAKP